MKHIDASPWCIDNEEIIANAEFISVSYKSLLEIAQHVDSQIRDNIIRCQMIISTKDFNKFIFEMHKHFEGDIKAREEEEYILTFYLDLKK